MLTSGNPQGTWLRYQNYISFVGEYFSATDGEKTMAALAGLYLSSHMLVFWMQLLLRVSRLLVVFMFSLLARPVRSH